MTNKTSLRVCTKQCIRGIHDSVIHNLVVLEIATATEDIEPREYYEKVLDELNINEMIIISNLLEEEN